MDAVLPRHDPEDVVRAPRPGGLLTAAAAVPLGAAVLLAAGHLPGGARAVLGVAVVVLGLALLRTHGTVTGARLGPGVSDALGAIVVVLGAGMVAGALGVAVDGADDGGLGGWGATVFWLLLAAAGVALLGMPRGGRATMRAAEAVLGVALALALAALLGPGALGLGATADGLLLLAAAVAAVATAAVARTAAGGPRVGLVAAGVLLACVGGDAMQLVGTATAHALPGHDGDPSSVLGAVRALGVPFVAAGLLLVGARRRHVPSVVLAAAVLLAGHGDPDDAPALGLVVPAGGLLLTAALAASATARGAVGRALARLGGADDEGSDGPVDDRPVDRAEARGTAVAPDVALASVGVALVAGAAAVAGAYPGGAAAGVLALVLVLGALALGVALPDLPGAVAAAAGLAGVVTVQPVVAAVSGVSRSAWERGDTALVVGVAVVQAAAAVLVLARRREPPLLALGAVLVAAQAATALFALWGGQDASEPTPLLVAALGVPALGLVVVAALALLGPPRAVLPRQAVGAGLAYLAATGAPTLGAVLAFGDGGGASAGALLHGGVRVVALLLVVVLSLGLALLAATVARRPSVAVTAAALLGTVQAALYAGVVGAAVRDGAAVAPTALGDPLLGFGAAASGATESGAAWPVLFGVLGAVLLAAAWWLESRRPVPVGVDVTG